MKQLFVLLLTFVSLFSITAVYANEEVAKTYSLGTNKESCIAKLGGASGNVLSLLNPFQYIPVVPDECTKCAPSDDKTVCPFGESVPAPLTFLIAYIFRLIGMLISVGLYSLVLVAIVLGIRYVIGGLTTSSPYQVARDIRNVLSAIIIMLITGTILLQVLYGVFGINKTDLDKIIPDVCVPTIDSNGQSVCE